MSVWLRRAGLTALVLVLAWWAHAPILTAGPTGRELRLLAALDTRALPDDVVASLPPVPAPAVRALIAISGGARELVARDASWIGVRVLALVLLLATAVGLGAFVRSALAPWLGGDAAAWAARAATLLAPLHPLAGTSLGSLEALGLLFSCAVGTSGCALFLRGRQERRSAWIGAGFALLALAALGSRAALVFAVWMALAELASARRHRPWSVRVRTAATTLAAGAGGCLALGWFASARSDWSGGVDGAASALAGLDALAFAACEKLGVLLLPGGAEGASAPRLIALGAIALVACHPGILAARSAPRLWGWIAAVAAVGISVALLLHPRVRVEPGDLAASHVLLPAQILLAGVLACASTALAGARRWMLPILLAVAWAGAARGIASAWPRSAALVASAREDARAALAEHPLREDGAAAPARMWWIESPSALRASDRLAALDLVVPLALHGGAREGDVHSRALDAATFVAALREREADAWRSEGLIVLADVSTLQRPSSAAPMNAGRKAFLLGPRGASPGKRAWRGDASSPLFDFDPSRVTYVRVLPRADAALAQAPVLSWRALEEDCETGALGGVWIRDEQGPQAIFETGGSVAWLLGRRIARVLVEGELVHAFASAELLEELQGGRFTSSVKRAGDDWELAGPPAPPMSTVEPGSWSLLLLDLAELRSQRIECSVRAAGTLVAPRAALVAQRVEGELAWSLEYRSNAVTLMRAAGRGRP